MIIADVFDTHPLVWGGRRKSEVSTPPRCEMLPGEDRAPRRFEVKIPTAHGLVILELETMSRHLLQASAAHSGPGWRRIIDGDIAIAIRAEDHTEKGGRP